VVRYCPSLVSRKALRSAVLALCSFFFLVIAFLLHGRFVSFGLADHARHASIYELDGVAADCR
ncbi:MAG TPA: hypothetical protein VK901_12520, partial [Nitrospiraceae bacterium]|nr:hypothetical protein [Nitrospiraceae bacterium]